MKTIIDKKDRLINGNFFLRQYVYFELDNGEMILQNASSIVRIHEERLKKFLKEWDSYTNTLLSREDLYKYFNEDTDEVIDFLKAYQILEEKISPNLGIKKIKLYTNHPDFEFYVNKIFQKDYQNVVDISCYCKEKLDANDLLIEEGDLILSFLNPYNRKLAKDIRDKVKNTQDAFLMFTYVYNYAFYMDCLFNGFLKSPCHICHISNIESQLRITHSGSVTYQHMIDSLYAEKPSFMVETPLTEINLINIVTQLINKLEKVILLREGPYVNTETFLESSMYDLSTKELIVDNPIHWELCDCYE